jgi:small-conductance mechanosensitive channel
MTYTAIRGIILLCALCCLPLPGQRAHASESDATPATVADVAPLAERGSPAEVRFMNLTIVTLHATISDVTPASRAGRITEQLGRLNHREWSLPITTLQVAIDNTPATAIRLGDRLLFVLAPGDLPPGDTRGFDALVSEVQGKLREALIARSEFGRLSTFLRGLGFSVLATAVLGALIKLLIIVRQQLQAHLQHLVEQRVELSGRNRYDWANSALQLIARILRLLMGGFVLILMYGWLTFILKQFVFTQPMGDRLSGFFVRLLIEIGQAALNALPGLITVFVIFFLTKACRDLLGNFFANVARGNLSFPGMHPDTIGATSRIAYGLVWVIGFAFAYPYIPGSQTDIFKGLSVLAGLVLTLGSSSLVNQLMSGMTLIYSRSMRKGDLVQIGDVTGLVEEVSALSVKLLRINEEIIVPNAVVVGNTVRNYSRMTRDQSAVLSAKITIGYDTPWRQVHALLGEAAANTPGIVQVPASLVLQRALSDFFVEYELQVAIANTSMYVEIMSSLHANILDRFNESGVQIMSPHFAFQPSEPVVSRRSSLEDVLDKTS